MNMNELFNRLTNFKIRHIVDPSPIQVSNLPIRFIVKDDDFYEITEIALFRNEVVIIIE